MLGCGFAMGCVGSDWCGFGCGVEISVGLWVCHGFGLAWVIGVWVIGVGLWVCRGLRGFGLARVIGVGLWISVSGFFLGDWCGVW